MSDPQAPTAELSAASRSDPGRVRANNEDLAICEAVQRNLNAGIYQTGRLSPKHEAGLAWFQKQIGRTAG